MKSYSREKLVRNLPDVFDKAPDSNNAKLLSLDRDQLTHIRQDINSVKDTLSIDASSGRTLDLYGGRLGQPRGLASDEQYRVLLKAKIQRSLNSGSIPDLIRCLCETFGCAPEDIQLRETLCEVEAVALPLDALNAAGFSSAQATEIIRSLLPVGVSITEIIYAGTFEFTDREGVQDDETGFDYGTLGDLLAESDSPKLPI